MAKILSEYGPERSTPKASSVCGGVKEAKPLSYSPPVGPKGQMRQGPGLGQNNYGNAGTQGKR